MYLGFRYLGRTSSFITPNNTPANNTRTKAKIIFPVTGIPKIKFSESDAFKKIAMTTIKTAKNPYKRTFPESPSLYITKINAKNTSIVPASGCIKIKKQGTMRISNTTTLVLISCIFTFTELKYLATAKEHASLANSLGCIEILPN